MRNLFPAPFVLVYSKRFSLTKKRKYVRTKTRNHSIFRLDTHVP